MAHVPISAKNSRVVIGGIAVASKQWTVNVEADELETTNFESGGFHENIAGIRKLTFSIELDYNASLNLHEAGGGTVLAGSIISSIKLYINAPAAAQGPFWLLSYAFIKSVSPRADVKSTYSVTIQGNATGTFTYPTGAADATS